MIALTKSQAKVYEAIKDGCNVSSEIIAMSGMNRDDVRNAITALKKLGMVLSEHVDGKKNRATYMAVEKRYKIETRKHTSITEKVPKASGPDKLLENLTRTTLPPDVLSFLQAHRKYHRDTLREEIEHEYGIKLTRLQLCYIMDKHKISKYVSA